MLTSSELKCLELNNSDNNVYLHFRCYRASGGTGTGVLLQGISCNQSARNEYFLHLEPGQGGLTQAQSSTGNVVIG